MKKSVMLDKIQKAYNRVDELETNLRECHAEIKGIRNDLEDLPDNAEDIEDDEDESEEAESGD